MYRNIYDKGRFIATTLNKIENSEQFGEGNKAGNEVYVTFRSDIGW